MLQIPDDCLGSDGRPERQSPQRRLLHGGVMHRCGEAGVRDNFSDGFDHYRGSGVTYG